MPSATCQPDVSDFGPNNILAQALNLRFNVVEVFEALERLFGFLRKLHGCCFALHARKLGVRLHCTVGGGMAKNEEI